MAARKDDTRRRPRRRRQSGGKSGSSDRVAKARSRDDPGPRKAPRKPSDPAAKRARKPSDPAPKRAASRSAEPAARPARPPGHDVAPLRVIGVGASAGGLAAARQLIDHLAADQGLCVVLAVHLAPDGKSMMAELLSRSSPLPVQEAAEGLRLQRDHVYVIPPGPLLEVQDGAFHLVPRPAAEPSRAVDHLFRSLASHYGTGAVGIVLSGTASDGAAGLREIKSAGGLAIAQDPRTAEHDGMPRAAIATGAVDLVLPPEEMGPELLLRDGHPELDDGDFSHPNGELDRIFVLLRNAHGIDFGQYKRPTIRRRIQRRMMIRREDRLASYRSLLEREVEEVAALGEDLLIQVTRFFREPDSFECLERQVFPEILDRKSAGDPIRVWVPGCASGEEAYSVAIALLEALENRASEPPLHIFATDVSERAIEVARAGFYPRAIDADVSPERLRRFFTRIETGFRVSPSVREFCIFARQDLTRDPPFSHVDLVVCRNLLIYLEPPAQQRVIRTFHYALTPAGHLLLGESETIGDEGNLFALADKRYKLYRKRPVETPVRFRAGSAPSFAGSAARSARSAAPRLDSAAEARRILLERYARPAVVVDSNFQIVESVGRTGRYLELGPGSASLGLLKMARPGLTVGLRAALGECRKKGVSARRSALRMEVDGGDSVQVDVVATPIGDSEGTPDRYLVVFEEEATDAPAGARVAVGSAKKRGGPRSRRSRAASSESPRTRELEEELDATRAHMQSVIQDLEGANEELQSANEEILSSNEELQSTNEELDTAREELQSTNEEIGTVNDELRGRNEELLRLNSDLENLLNNVQIAVVIVTQDLRIRRFTTAAERLLNLIHADVGRPIGQIRPNFELAGLEARIRAVIDSVEPFEQELRSDRGQWLALRIRPYKDVENRIDGAVLSLMDVTQLRQHELELRRASRFLEAILDGVGEGLALLDENGRVVRANDRFCRLWGVAGDEALGRTLWDLREGAWDLGPLRRSLEAAVLEEVAEDDVVVSSLGAQPRPSLRVNLRPLRVAADGPGIVLAVREALE